MNKKIRILIVDDVSINRQILSALFDAEYEILEADDGTTALEVLEKNEVDIIILDIIMPKMNGLEFLQTIKQNPKYKNISVIISTEAGGTENEYRALKIGADNFITRPYNPNIIKYRVKNLVDTYIKRRVELEKAVRETERKVFTLVNAIPDGVIIAKKTDKYRVFYTNDKLFQMLGYTKKESKSHMNTDIFSYIYEEDHEKVRKVLEENSVHGKCVNCFAGLYHKDGSIVATELSVRLLVLENGTKLYYAVISNISKDREKEEILKKELHKYQERMKKDVLTGIYNYETFLNETEQLLARHPKEQFVIGEWNIDRFKAVNELFGSRAGDRIICAFAEHLKEKHTGFGTYGRREADHFVTCCTEEYLERNAVQIEQLLSGNATWNPLNYPISLHVGFYRIEQEDKDVALMCDRAGMALQQIKDSYIQREKYFNTELLDALVKEQEMMRAVETALREKQFVIEYQPIIEVKTGEIIAAEALVRWRKPNGEIVPPNEFLPMFERNGFISRLDMYVWEEVCVFQSSRKRAGKRIVPISVNLSRIDFYQSTLFEDIKGLLARYELGTDCLELEITESAYMDQPQELMATIQQFQRSGFKILMDDFGSGFSSLNMLKDVCADSLKIDMRFMENLETSDRAGNILYSIIQMAKAIHMEVIAEGVETVNQYEMLMSMNCDWVQGYYFFRPLKEEIFSEKLDENHVCIIENKSLLRQSILVVDDMELERDMLTALIGDDYHVLTAAGVDEAAELLKQEFSSISLVISDIVMPKKNGFELLKIMKEKMFFRDIPVLMVTAYGEYENIQRALSMGALDVVTKPYDPATFRQRLQNMLRISEREAVKREIYSLREDVLLRKQVDSILEDSGAGIIRLKLDADKLDTIREVVYVNGRFLYFHRLTLQEALEKKSLAELMMNVSAGDRKVLETKLKEAVKSGQKSFSRELRVEWDNGTARTMYLNCTLQYSEEELLLDIMTMECESGAEYRLDRTIQMICEQLGASIGLEMWRYYLKVDVIEYYQKGYDGKYIRRIVRNGQENTVHSSIFQDKDRGRLKEIHRRILAGEEFVQEDFQVYPPSAQKKELSWIQLTMVRIDMPGEEEGIMLGFSKSIMEEKKYQERKWREQQYQEIFSKGAEFFAEADLTENCFISEESLKQFHEYKTGQKDTSYDTMLQGFLRTVSKEDVQRCGDMLNRKKLLEWYGNGEREVKFDFLSDVEEKGVFEWYTSDMFLVKNNEDGHVYASWQIKNVQHEKQRLNSMKRLAERDNLTGLYNRIMLEKGMDTTLAAVRQKNKMSAFFMIDIDNFKAVNDNFGHDIGDSVLKAIASLLIQTFRAEDVIARLGGDEFAVFIARATSKDWVYKRAQVLCENSYLEMDNQGVKIYVSCSVGIVFGGENGNSFKELYPKADQALYCAKKNGKNCFKVYEPSMDTEEK